VVIRSTVFGDITACSSLKEVDVSEEHRLMVEQTERDNQRQNRVTAGLNISDYARNRRKWNCGPQFSLILFFFCSYLIIALS
jgi:hypothetical protein